MTIEERLAIYREVLTCCTHGILPSDSLYFATSNLGTHLVFRTPGSQERLAEAEDIAEAIYAARQKLAAEREAAMSPNERKYKAALESIYSYLVGVYGKDHRAVVTAREALKEST